MLAWEFMMMFQTVRCGGLTLYPLKSGFIWQQPLVRISHFWICVAFCWRHDHRRILCARLPPSFLPAFERNTLLGKKISFTLNTLLLYVVITTFSWPLVVGSRRGVSLLTYHFRLWSWLHIIAVKLAQVHSCQSRGPSLLTRCNVALKANGK